MGNLRESYAQKIGIEYRIDLEEISSLWPKPGGPANGGLNG